MSDEVHLRALPLMGLPAGGDAATPESLLPCGQRPVSTAAPLDSVQLARMAMDYAPGVGDEAPSWMLGDAADALDPTVQGHTRAWIAAVAVAAFALAPGANRSPFRSWFRDDPRPDATARQAGLAVLLTPFLPWRLGPGQGTRWTVTPALPVQPWWVPGEPVDLSDAGWLIAPPATGDVLLARLVPTPTGPRPVTALVLPGRPDEATLRRWFGRLAGPMKAENPSLRREDVYRRAGHHLAALACGGAR